jgi:predicted nucleotidyltransferase
MKPSDLLKNSSAEIKRIAYSHGFKNIRVFGSAINNTDHEGSDLDLLVEPSESTTLMTIGALRSELRQKFNIEVDVLTPAALPIKWRQNVLTNAHRL